MTSFFYQEKAQKIVSHFTDEQRDARGGLGVLPKLPVRSRSFDLSLFCLNFQVIFTFYNITVVSTRKQDKNEQTPDVSFFNGAYKYFSAASGGPMLPAWAQPSKMNLEACAHTFRYTHVCRCAVGVRVTSQKEEKRERILS